MLYIKVYELNVFNLTFSSSSCSSCLLVQSSEPLLVSRAHYCFPQWLPHPSSCKRASSEGFCSLLATICNLAARFEPWPSDHEYLKRNQERKRNKSLDVYYITIEGDILERQLVLKRSRTFAAKRDAFWSLIKPIVTLYALIEGCSERY